MTSKPTAVIFDIDGTLADVSSILHHVDAAHPDYVGQVDLDTFHFLSPHVPVIAPTLVLAEQVLVSGHQIVMMTSRSERYRGQTEYFLNKHGVERSALHMRPDDDFDQDTVSKRRMLLAIMEQYQVVGAVDDNPYVVALLSSYGIPVTVIPGWPHPLHLPEPAGIPLGKFRTP